MNHLQNVSSAAALESADSAKPGEVLILDSRNGLTPSDMVERRLQGLLSVHPCLIVQRDGELRDQHCRKVDASSGWLSPIEQPFEKEHVMQVVQQGDTVQVHYVKVFQDGSVVASQGQVPTELTVGLDHPRLPGLGLALVGLAVGESRILVVPAKDAYGPRERRLIRRLARHRFSEHKNLSVGQWVRVWDRQCRRRLVRIVEIGENTVVVDANHPRAGQSLELEVAVLAIHEQEEAGKEALRE